MYVQHYVCMYICNDTTSQLKTKWKRKESQRKIQANLTAFVLCTARLFPYRFSVYYGGSYELLILSENSYCASVQDALNNSLSASCVVHSPIIHNMYIHISIQREWWGGWGLNIYLFSPLFFLSSFHSSLFLFPLWKSNIAEGGGGVELPPFHHP